MQYAPSIWIFHRRYPVQAAQSISLNHRTSTRSTTHPVTTDLLPFDLLSRNRKLSAQALESTLVEFCKCLVDLCLVVLLPLCDFADSVGGVGDGDGLGGLEAHVAVFVVMDVDVDGTGNGVVGGSEEVVGTPSSIPVYVSAIVSPCQRWRAVPEVVGAVLVADQHKGNLGVVLSRENANSSGRIVFVGMRAQSLVQALNHVGIRAVQCVALCVGSLLGDGVKVKGGV